MATSEVGPPCKSPMCNPTQEMSFTATSHDACYVPLNVIAFINYSATILAALSCIQIATTLHLLIAVSRYYNHQQQPILTIQGIKYMADDPWLSAVAGIVRVTLTVRDTLTRE